MGKLHLIRHAHYPRLESRTLSGREPGHDLSPAGHATAGLLAARFAGLPVRAVRSSPLARAMQTAGPIAAAHGLTVVPDARLTELDYGEWTGRDWATLDGPAWRCWNAARGIAAIPGGESAHAVAARALACAREASAADGEAVLVTHADVIRALLGAALGLAPDLWLRLRIDPASRSVLTLHEAGAEIGAVNLPP